MRAEQLAGGFAFTEGPRWRNGLLFFSDMFDHRVVSLHPDSGTTATVALLDGQPSGLGWDPEGRLVVVDMQHRRLLRETIAGSGHLQPHADLQHIEPVRCNDLLVDDTGRAYVSGFGFDLFAGAAPAPTPIAVVSPGGTATAGTAPLQFPNGMAILAGSPTFVVAETLGDVITAFDLAADGSLSRPRTWARFRRGSMPDGISADDHGRLWVALPARRAVVLLEDGTELDRVETPGRFPMACAVGDSTLFICTSTHGDPRRDADARSAAVEAAAL